MVASTWLGDHQGRPSAPTNSLHKLHMARYQVLLTYLTGGQQKTQFIKDFIQLCTIWKFVFNCELILTRTVLGRVSLSSIFAWMAVNPHGEEIRPSCALVISIIKTTCESRSSSDKPYHYIIARRERYASKFIF